MTKVKSNLTDGTTTSGPAKRPRRKAEYVLLKGDVEMCGGEITYRIVIPHCTSQQEVLAEARKQGTTGRFVVAALHRTIEIKPKNVESQLVIEDVD